jgi:hypothetical protein
MLILDKHEDGGIPIMPRGNQQKTKNKTQIKTKQNNKHLLFNQLRLYTTEFMLIYMKIYNKLI